MSENNQPFRLRDLKSPCRCFVRVTGEHDTALSPGIKSLNCGFKAWCGAKQQKGRRIVMGVPAVLWLVWTVSGLKSRWPRWTAPQEFLQPGWITNLYSDSTTESDELKEGTKESTSHEYVKHARTKRLPPDFNVLAQKYILFRHYKWVLGE